MRKKKEEKLEKIFEEEFVIGNAVVDKKDIEEYIRGKAIPVLDEDFYYGYTYREGVLNYVALKSGRYLKGKISVFTPAFLEEGVYYYCPKDSSIYYVVENKEGKVSVKTEYEAPKNAKNLDEIQIKASQIPETLKLKWSLEKSSLNLILVSTGIFLFSLAFYLFSLVQYSKLEVKARELATLYKPSVGKEQKIQTLANKDISPIIDKVAKEVNGKGYIEKIEGTKGKLIFSIVFKNETYAQEFVKKLGGSYENGKVIYTVSINNT